ncbi:hypothetical protein ZHAS_00017730 [Anopheles sinensis]|uniref:Uncharacterized protein n=1 Tax=Anopheles sinensis TaxID=74873 RepID=A0A084WH31_ANOSI|nr:hypothetical protein ZHAS_00017730 [Anopheles sinensis]
MEADFRRSETSRRRKLPHLSTRRLTSATHRPPGTISNLYLLCFHFRFRSIVAVAPPHHRSPKRHHEVAADVLGGAVSVGAE